MDDYISRQTAREAFLRHLSRKSNREQAVVDWHSVKVILSSIPAVDGRPVVFCKDCEYGYDSICGWCCSRGPCVDCIVREDFFCADGKRREGGADG